MSKLIATITDILNKDNLHIVKFDYFGTQLQMLSLELDQNIKIGAKVSLGVKSTNIVISKDFQGSISYTNQIKAKIKDCTNGELLSSIILEIHNSTIEAIITSQSSKEMDLKIDEEVTIFINASDLSIFEVILDD